MPKKKTIQVRPRAERARILREAKAKGLTAEQVQKKYGVSKWTFYGWRKRLPKSPAVRGALRHEAAVIDSALLHRELRAVLPGILREEIARTLGTLFGKRAR